MRFLCVHLAVSAHMFMELIIVIAHRSELVKWLLGHARITPRRDSLIGPTTPCGQCLASRWCRRSRQPQSWDRPMCPPMGKPGELPC